MGLKTTKYKKLLQAQGLYLILYMLNLMYGKPLFMFTILLSVVFLIITYLLVKTEFTDKTIIGLFLVFAIIDMICFFSIKINFFSVLAYIISAFLLIAIIFNQRKSEDAKKAMKIISIYTILKIIFILSLIFI